MEPEIRYRSAHEVCAIWGAVVIRICDGVRTEVEDLERVDKLFDELLATHGAIGMLLVFTHDTPLPTPAAQRYTMSSMSRYGPRLTIAVAALGLGFWASALRSTVDMILRVVRARNAVVEGSAEAAVSRLANELIGIDPDALLSAYEGLWSELEQQRLAS